MTVTPANEVRFAALHHRNFTLLWSGLLVSNVRTWMQNVAQGWLVLQLTNSPLWLGRLRPQVGNVVRAAAAASGNRPMTFLWGGWPLDQRRPHRLPALM